MSRIDTAPETNKMRAVSDQETFWVGEFGDAYTTRNAVNPEDRVPFLKEVLGATSGVASVLELGANKGHNLIALRSIAPSLRVTGVELNPSAFQQLSSIAGITAVHSAIQDFSSQQNFDLVFTCGVLIHINPDNLPAVYKKMAALASKYVLINEYFNPLRLKSCIEDIPASCSSAILRGSSWIRPGDSKLYAGGSCGSAWNQRGITATGH